MGVVCEDVEAVDCTCALAGYGDVFDVEMGKE